jgi:prephenate dehydratase
MAISLAHLGPPGTNAETAALVYAGLLEKNRGEKAFLCPLATIAQTIEAAAQQQADLAVVPVENSTEGSIAVTLDRLWQYDWLKIQQELLLPISHALLSRSSSLADIQTVYSHPQALAQCQQWLEQTLPAAQLVATSSTTEAVRHADRQPTAGAIASPRAAKMYGLPAIAEGIQDYPDNCTRFWVLGTTPTTRGERLSLAFSVPANLPGALVKPLQAFARRGINLSRIESRPTKRSLGEYLFYIDLEGCEEQPAVQEALTELATHTDVLKIFGSYTILPIQVSDTTKI